MKTVEPEGSVGSNPTASAIKNHVCETLEKTDIDIEIYDGGASLYVFGEGSTWDYYNDEYETVWVEVPHIIYCPYCGERLVDGD